MFNPEQCDFVSMAEAKEREKQNPAAETARAASIAFVALAESGQIDDVTASENVSQFSPWAYPVAYAVGNIRAYGGELYRCNQAHTSQADWTPPATPGPYGRRSPIRPWNGPNGPNRWAHTTPMTPATRSPTTANTGLLTWTGTSGNPASMAGQKCRSNPERRSTPVTEGILIAVLSLLGTLGGSYFANKKSSALIAYRLEELEKKVDKHNSVIERTYSLEEAQAVIEEKIKVADHRIDDLEKKT